MTVVEYVGLRHSVLSVVDVVDESFVGCRTL